MEESLPSEGVHSESFYATEGTAAHELGEIKARLEFDMISKNLYNRRRHAWRRKYTWISDEIEEEMDVHTDAYVALIVDRMSLYENSQLMLEQRLQTGLPECWGTSDTVIVSPQHVEIIDFKYGMGVQVEAVGNPQLRLYALGALDTYGDLLGETEVVRATVHQPRLSHVLTEELTPEELRSWRTFIRPTAELALTDHAPFGPSDEACRWCPVSGRCQAQLESIFATDFDVEPELLSPEEMSEILDKVPAIRDWLNAFEEAALTAAYSRGEKIPGYKVVLSGGKRTFTDPEGAISYLVERGYQQDEVSVRRIRGIGELEKLLGKDEFVRTMAPFVEKGKGRPSLAPDTDRRPAIEPNTEAKKEFENE